MQSLDQHLKTLVKQRRISQEEALKRAVEPDAFLQDRIGPPSQMEPTGFVSRRP
jgi:hypothetical protein